jgi:hypothetical protein
MATSGVSLRCKYMDQWPISLVAIVFGGTLLGIGVGVRLSEDKAEKLEIRFAQSGVKADGKVVGKRTAREHRPVGRNQNQSVLVFSIDYQFTDASGTLRRGGSRVSESDFKSTTRGATIRVEYLPDEPETSRIVQAASQSPSPNWLAPTMIGLGITLAVGGFAWLSYGFVKAGRRARVVRHGSPFLGWVGEIVEYPQKKGPAKYTLSFAFKDPDGDDSEGWVWLPIHLKEQWKSGDPILVLWDGQADSYAEPDIFGIRADDLRQRLNESAVSNEPHRKKKRQRKS